MSAYCPVDCACHGMSMYRPIDCACHSMSVYCPIDCSCHSMSVYCPTDCGYHNMHCIVPLTVASTVTVLVCCPVCWCVPLFLWLSWDVCVSSCCVTVSALNCPLADWAGVARLVKTSTRQPEISWSASCAVRCLLTNRMLS